MSLDINVCRHHFLKYQSVILVVTYSTTTWQQGERLINVFSYILDLGETRCNIVHITEIVTSSVLVFWGSKGQ